MKKLLHSLLFVLICSAISAQDTLVAFKFDVINSNLPTITNSFNSGDLLLRESTYSNPYSYPTGLDSYCLTSDGWVNSWINAGGYYTTFSSIGRNNIFISSRQKSSPTGPRDFKLQYKVGASGIWVDVIDTIIKCSSTNFVYGWMRNLPLPDVCNNKPDVNLRWLVISDTNATGGLIDINGTSSIDNVFIVSNFIEDSAYLDINLIKARIHTGGLNFYSNNMSAPGFEYPKDSGKHTIYSSGLWIGGKNQGNLHLAAERFHGNGRDYYPGHIMDSAKAQTEMIHWNKLWKINKSDIDYHIANWNATGYIMPASISQWPVYANPGFGINYYLAPFVDHDSNGAYNPTNGDYPKIRGDQAIYYIFNDSVYPHTESGGKRLGVEVHAMAYAYNSVPLLTKTIFMNYLVYNRSNRVYDSLYMGLFTDIDIGYPKDDYIGCDSTLGTYYGYNADSMDSNGTGVSYGANPPVQTVTFLNQNLNSFVAFNNTGGTELFTDPEFAQEYYRLMTNNFCLDTASLTWGTGHWGPQYAYCSKYMFPGNPNDSNMYCEHGLGNAPYDRRGVGINGPVTMLPGQYISFDAAYITVDSGFVKSKGFSNVDNMLSIVPHIRDYFNTHFPSNGSDVALGIGSQNKNDIVPQFTVYPNPTTNKIIFTSNLSSTKLTLDVLDINGRLIQSYECYGSKKEIDVSNYKNGVYILKISSAYQSSFVKFIKM